jgi:hypothetical protein
VDLHLVGGDPAVNQFSGIEGIEGVTTHIRG